MLGHLLGRGVLISVVLIIGEDALGMSLTSGSHRLDLSRRGSEVGTSLLLSYYQEVPEVREGEPLKAWASRSKEALTQFRVKVADRYSEGTLQRLTDSPSRPTRSAAVLALHLTGSMSSSEALVRRLRDADEAIRLMASEALWAIWFRGESAGQNQELERYLEGKDPKKAILGLTGLIRKAPGFAEAYNQRAILYFQLQEYDRCAADCQKVLQLNPYHFGAASGLGRCYLRLRLPGPALKAFRLAHKLNPNLDGVEEAIRDLESVLGEEGKRD